MRRGGIIRQLRDKRGQTLVEFAMVAVLTLMLLLAVVEFGRMVLAYATVNNAARVGLRFAMVHGVDNLASATDVQTVVNYYLTAAAIDTSTVTVTLSYPAYAASGCAANSKKAGCPVEVQVSYPYQTMLSYFPIHLNLASQAEGIITF